MIDKSIIGKEYPPFIVEVEKRWVRSFAHFGALVSTPMAARNSQRVRKDESLRDRYFDNDVFRFFEFYSCSERRLAELSNLGYAYFQAGDFSRAAEDAFVIASRIDDLAEPEPQAIDQLPELPRLLVTCTPGITNPRVLDRLAA